jgi:uncharacterized protein YfiM (DUF2279 family)
MRFLLLAVLAVVLTGCLTTDERAKLDGLLGRAVALEQALSAKVQAGTISPADALAAAKEVGDLKSEIAALKASSGQSWWTMIAEIAGSILGVQLLRGQASGGLLGALAKKRTSTPG